VRPARRRELAGWFQGTFQVGCARAGRLAQFSRAAWYRHRRARDQSAQRLRIRVLLRREGWVVNRKRVRRRYRLDGLQLRLRVGRRKHVALHRGPAPVPTGPTEALTGGGPEDVRTYGGRVEDFTYRRGVQVDFIRHGKPIETAFVESFTGVRCPTTGHDHRRSGAGLATSCLASGPTSSSRKVHGRSAYLTGKLTP
jgi:hypothetical protein